MYIFRRPDYRSHATQFLDTLHKNDPQLSQRQQASRCQTWADDTPAATKLQAHHANASDHADTLAQTGYVYLTQPFTQA